MKKHLLHLAAHFGSGLFWSQVFVGATYEYSEYRIIPLWVSVPLAIISSYLVYVYWREHVDN